MTDRRHRYLGAAITALCGVLAWGEPLATEGTLTAGELASLRSLSPDVPEKYLELGEEVLDRPDAPERVVLARQLLVRAVEYGRVRPGAERSAASAALALASISPQAAQRRWLRAVASTLHPEYGLLKQRERIEAGAGARGAEMLTRLRAGEGVRPRELLADAEVRATLVRNEAGLSAEGTISLSDLEAVAKRQPCVGCAGRRTVANQGPRSATVCPNCRGRAMLAVSARDLASQLMLQLMLLGEDQQEWGKSTESEAAPARDPDAAEVAVVFGMDTKLSVWRDGRWEKPGNPAGSEAAQEGAEKESPTVAPDR